MGDFWFSYYLIHFEIFRGFSQNNNAVEVRELSFLDWLLSNCLVPLMAIGLPNLIVGIAIGLLTAIFVEEFRYRHQRKLATMQRLSPLLEEALGICVRIVRCGEDARYLKHHFLQYSASKKANETPLSKEFKAIFVQHSYRELLSMMKEARYFETVYSELLRSGLLERIKAYNSILYGKLGWLHSCTETWCRTKIDSFQDALDAGTSILVNNTLLFAEDCEKSLRKFL